MQGFEVVIRQGLRALKRKISVVIYPQSTCTAVFDPPDIQQPGG